MQPGQRIAFTSVLLFGATICAALALGKLSPPPEPNFVPPTTAAPAITSSTNTLIITSAQVIVIHAGTTFEGSAIEQAEMRPANYSTELLDTTSPVPAITFE